MLTLRPGDAYVMCETACGFRWKAELRTPHVVHYRHAAGAPGSTKWTPTMEAIRAASAKKLAAKRKRAAQTNDGRAGAPAATAQAAEVAAAEGLAGKEAPASKRPRSKAGVLSPLAV